MGLGEQTAVITKAAQRHRAAVRAEKASKVLHPKEQAELQLRARENVQEDLQLLIASAERKKQGTMGLRALVLGTRECEELLTALMVHLEKLP
jgi:hypothetical protein